MILNTSKQQEMMAMKELFNAEDLETTVADLYETINERLSLHMIDNEVSSVYVAIFVGNMFFRFRNEYESSSIEEVSEDLHDYFVGIKENLADKESKVIFDSVVMIIE